jgi:magnesium-protoporphyrin O-methyltransferase
MAPITYTNRREQLTEYFDQTATKAWEQLTSDEPVSGIRATVRAGRDSMRSWLLEQLPEDLTGRRILDAGCGTGAFAVEAARRGADVTAIDVAENLIGIARSRAPADLGKGSIDFRVGDMCDEQLGEFDHAVAMDSLIHYQPQDVLGVLRDLADRCRRSVMFTFAPRTRALAAMHIVGRLIPHRHHRAPSIVPINESKLRQQIDSEMADGGWRVSNDRRVNSGFYISQAMELRRK